MTKRPVKVLHVLGSLDRGGAETWTVQLLENLDRQRIQVDVLVHRRGGVYEDRVKACGAEILMGGDPHQVWKYTRHLKTLLLENGPFDVVHSHLQLYSGLILRVAHQAGIPGRIAHARNSQDGQNPGLFRTVYRALARHWIRQYATHVFAVSTEAAEGAFGSSRHCRIMTGIDFSAFPVSLDRAVLRRQFDISDQALVIGHIGSFRRQKNHQFLITVAQQVLMQRPDAIFLLIGEGTLKSSVEDRVRSLGIAQNFRFLGERHDIPQMLHIMDVFAFPSFYEGLPRALVEAQAAGVPCIASRSVTIEAAAFPHSVVYLGLDAKIWAETLVAVAGISAINGAAAVAEFEKRGMSIAANAKDLTELYEMIANGQ